MKRKAVSFPFRFSSEKKKKGIAMPQRSATATAAVAVATALCYASSVLFVNCEIRFPFVFFFLSFPCPFSVNLKSYALCTVHH